MLAPEGYEYGSLHERGYGDAGCRTHQRFLAEVPNCLTPDGRALLHFSSRADMSALRGMAAESVGGAPSASRSRVPGEPPTVEFRLDDRVGRVGRGVSGSGG